MTFKKMGKKIQKNLGKIIMYLVLILMCLAVLFPFAIVITAIVLNHSVTRFNRRVLHVGRIQEK